MCIFTAGNISGPSSNVVIAMFTNMNMSVNTWHIYTFDSFDDEIPFTDSVPCTRKRVMLL